MTEYNYVSDKIGKFLIEIAKVSDYVGKNRHAACITYKKQTISYGVNQLKTHPIMLEFFPKDKIFLHAEISAIISAINECGHKFLSKCDLHVIRLDYNNELKLSKPCKYCTEAINFYNIKNVYYS